MDIFVSCILRHLILKYILMSIADRREAATDDYLSGLKQREEAVCAEEKYVLALDDNMKGRYSLS